MYPTFPSFDSAEEIRSLLDEPALDPSILRNTGRFVGRTLLDEFRELKQIADEATLTDKLRRIENAIGISHRQDRKGILIKLKLNPGLAALVSHEGKARIGNDVFSVLEEEPALAVRASVKDYEYTDDRGYAFSEYPPANSMFWFPCSKVWQIPVIYPEKHIDMTIGGRSVLVQLWKGYLPPNILAGEAGGVGAEVGLYKRGKIRSLWWPELDQPQHLQFTLINPTIDEPIFTTRKEHTWWLHTWMKDSSYDKYSEDQHGDVPKHRYDCKLQYWINDEPMPIWN